MGVKEKVWESAQGDVIALIQEGRIAKALELQEALDESKALGEVTIRLAQMQSGILISRAEEVAGIVRQSEVMYHCQPTAGHFS